VRRRVIRPCRQDLEMRNFWRLQASHTNDNHHTKTIRKLHNQHRSMLMALEKYQENISSNNNGSTGPLAAPSSPAKAKTASIMHDS